ncbi:L-aspartate oxidase [Wenzhouxiangella sediminis]|uniref:L-aspartate oxidase n=1 Tax=Wenzhouxiangella sediminis TaxID=1792836 RepID=UPI001C6EB332|nr:L-aspartate oxidase [Wenzhouxiangella sediminis]
MSSRPIIVVGSGIAGLWTALHAAPAPVLMLTSGAFGRQSATEWAQGGIAAALGEDDDPGQHAADTVAAGAGLVDAAVARRLATGSVDQVRALERLGVGFEHHEDGRWALSREAAHSRARVARVGGDRAGTAIINALISAVERADHVTVREHASVLGLVPAAGGGCAGVVVDAGGGRCEKLSARATVLATGGLGGLYALTTNPPGNQGQGLAWATRLGAVVRDAEFVQFHPTAIDIGRNPAPLATEALRGEGAVLIDRRGKRFMPALHPDAELAPRDVVARAVHRQVQSGAGAYLDAREAVGAAFPETFQAVFRACMAAGIDPRREPIPVAPAAHYHMGGIAADLDGSTGIRGLFAVGEVSCTGAHGANRLASNSLAEALVMGARAGQVLANATDQALRSAEPGRSVALPRESLDRLRSAMNAHAGVERDENGLVRLLDVIEDLERKDGLSDALVAARLIALAALKRRESRGAHFRTDYPEPAAEARSSRLTLEDAASARTERTTGSERS